jgi:hypothetical protein
MTFPVSLGYSFLQEKSETKGVVKKFIRRVQIEFKLNVKNIRSDNVSEFRNTQVEEHSRRHQA